MKTVVEKSAGSNFSALIKVHEAILEKHRPSLDADQYKSIKVAMYDHLIILSYLVPKKSSLVTMTSLKNKI